MSPLSDFGLNRKNSSADLSAASTADRAARAIVPAATGRVTWILNLLLTFYQRVRDRDHLAALDLSARNDLRQDRVDEETRRRFWQS